MDTSRFLSPSGKAWAATVTGSAFHALQHDEACGRPAKSFAEYFDEACAKEGRPIEFAESESPATCVEEMKGLHLALNQRWKRPADALSEWSFLFWVLIDGQQVWFEGTVDLFSLAEATLYDFKTGDVPDAQFSPQHHLYALAVRWGWWSNPRHFPDRHQLDWTTATEAPRRFNIWPRFRYLHLPRLVGSAAGQWNVLAMARTGHGLNETDSLDYITGLARKLLSQPNPQPLPTMQPQTTTALSVPTHAPKYEMTTEEVVAQGKKIQDVMHAAMKPDEDYGIVPGTSRMKKVKGKDGREVEVETAKPTLLKPGAEKLLLLFRLAPEFKIDKTAEGEHREVFVRCRLTHITSGDFVGEGVGECSTRESKYAWRVAERKCPKCDMPALKKSKPPRKGWYCWSKLQGCGETFEENDSEIIGQEVGRKPNPDLADTYNTVTKMACKRALVMAVLNTTGASFLFTQDLEDFAPTAVEEPVIDSPAPKPEPKQVRATVAGPREVKPESPPPAPSTKTPEPAAAAPTYSWGEPAGDVTVAMLTEVRDLFTQYCDAAAKGWVPIDVAFAAAAKHGGVPIDVSKPFSAIPAKAIAAVIAWAKARFAKKTAPPTDAELVTLEREAAANELLGGDKRNFAKQLKADVIAGTVKPSQIREWLDNTDGKHTLADCNDGELVKCSKWLAGVNAKATAGVAS